MSNIVVSIYPVSKGFIRVSSGSLNILVIVIVIVFEIILT